ncbi:phytoene desaturase family protein [Rhabdothermincola salaria]|uniref:phytoene desaturase family protein n=1 Tax=Rhabdothermincola salaria TaxID=2903142 RepID=UPI0032119756
MVGAGPNGLVAANLLASAGWDVVVLEAAPVPGGAVRTAEVTAPGFRNDLFSAFYPLAAASPVVGALELERHGLSWSRAPLVLAHPTPDGPTMVLSTDLDRTAASLDRFVPGDGDAWRTLYGTWSRVSGPLIDALLAPLPPVVPSARLAGRLGVHGGLDFLRDALTPVRSLARERFAGEGGALLLAGNALHADFTPETAGGGLFGWLLASLGQQLGFPVPTGGAGCFVDALVHRLRGLGGRVVTGARVDRVVVEGGRAIGVTTEQGHRVVARRAVLADVGAPSLFLDLVGADHLDDRLLRRLARFEYDHATVKVDWALDRPIPWSDPEVGGAGTVHLADSLDALSRFAYELATGQVPSRPFMLMGQMTTSDPTRSPAGTESAWAYTHVPQRVRRDAGGDGLTGSWDDHETEQMAARMERIVEEYAPGFGARVIARHVATPRSMERVDANLVGGAINGGTAQIHQQLVFRPLPGGGRASTPIKGLFLASASAHPGGGVHGAPGSNAARAALAADRRRRVLRAVRPSRPRG